MELTPERRSDEPAEPTVRNAQSDHSSGAGDSPALSMRDLAIMFLKASVTFGTGTGMSLVLLRELVEKRRAMSRADFMSLYGLARIIPTGSFTALAVAVGYRFQRFPGTVVAQLAMMVPPFTLLVGLTVAYTSLAGNPTFDLVTRALMPAALAIVFVGSWKLLQEFLYPSVELMLAVGAFVALHFFGISPQLLMIVGAIIGAIAIRPRRKEPGE